MARRRVKKRTQTRNPQNDSGRNMNLSPKSMVIRIGAGDVGPSVSQLAHDVRSVMEPETASRLKERKANKLRDYTTMCGPLGVTHLILVSRSPAGNTNLRIAITPRGPTLHFRVDNYSLCKDIMKAMRHPKNDKNLYKSPPLLVMNNFLTLQNASTSSKEPRENQAKGVPKHLEQLCTTVFQSLFPPLTPQTTPLSSIKRVLLLNREANPRPSADPQIANDEPDNPSYIITFRHYAITTKTASASRAVKRLKSAEKKSAVAASASGTKKRGRSVPNLGSLPDVSDWVLHGDDPGAYTSASESEPDTDAEVEVGVVDRRALHRKERSAEDGEKGAKKSSRGMHSRVEKRAVKLVELGPRMRMRLVKVEEGVCSGKVMWHEFVDKSPEEVKKQEKMWEKRRSEKDARRQEQRENIEKKRKDRKAGGKDAEDDENEYDTDDIEHLDDDDLDEMAYEDMSEDEELLGDDGAEDEGMEVAENE